MNEAEAKLILPEEEVAPFLEFLHAQIGETFEEVVAGTMTAAAGVEALLDVVAEFTKRRIPGPVDDVVIDAALEPLQDVIGNIKALQPLTSEQLRERADERRALAELLEDQADDLLSDDKRQIFEKLIAKRKRARAAKLADLAQDDDDAADALDYDGGR